MQMKLLGITNVDLCVIDKRITKSSSIQRILVRTWKYNGTIHQLFIDFKKAYHSFRKEVLYKILIQFPIPRKLVELIKICVN
jgi:hypothetical protein